MRILVLHSELGVLRGGGENFTRNLFTAFAERGHDVSAAFVADRKGRYPISLPAVIKPVPIRGWWSRNLGEAMLSTISRRIPFQSRLRKTWDRLQEAMSWRAIRWHSERFRRRVERELAYCWNDFDSLYVHGDVILASEVANHRPTILRLPGPVSADLSPFLQKVHAVCANGDALSRISRFLGERVIELPAGVDGRLFQPGLTAIRSALKWSNQELVIGYVGRLTPIKGIDLLAAAFVEILHKRTDVRLLIVGQGQAERAIRSTLSKELEQGKVHIEPDIEHEQLPQWYRAMDLFVMPSRYENHSNALLEAMACGIPFLASDVGGNTMVTETGAGWLFESESVSSLIACLSKILKSSPELKARGKIGFDYVQEHHSWAATAERLEKIIISRLGAEK